MKVLYSITHKFMNFRKRAFEILHAENKGYAGYLAATWRLCAKQILLLIP
jgi:hypothetical protein